MFDNFGYSIIFEIENLNLMKKYILQITFIPNKIFTVQITVLITFNRS